PQHDRGALPRHRGRGLPAAARHVIASLVRKPGAFANYRFRDELYPTLPFRRAYDALVASHADRAAVEDVRILHLAAKTMEMSRLRSLSCSRLALASTAPPPRRS